MQIIKALEAIQRIRGEDDCLIYGELQILIDTIKAAVKNCEENIPKIYGFGNITIQTEPGGVCEVIEVERTPWQPIGTQPTDEWVILATTGGWVGEAIYGEDEENPQWRWKGAASREYIHQNFTPLGWQPLPASPEIQSEEEEI
jgi:hypothetical protein